MYSNMDGKFLTENPFPTIRAALLKARETSPGLRFLDEDYPPGKDFISTSKPGDHNHIGQTEFRPVRMVKGLDKDARCGFDDPSIDEPQQGQVKRTGTVKCIAHSCFRSVWG